MVGRILIVDDETNLVRSLTRILTLEGYQVQGVTSAREALANLEAREIDLVISDFKMPDMNGLELLKTVRHSYPGVTTILMTAFAEIDLVDDAINEAGVFKFILKPWNDQDLKRTVKSAIELKGLTHQKEQNRIPKTTLESLEASYPGITKVNRDENGSLLFPEEG